MSTKLFAALAAVSLGLGGAAQAEEFNGPYVGLQGGWNHDEVGTIDTRTGPASIEGSKDAFTGGAFAGYDVRLGSGIVIGAEAAFSLAAKDQLFRGGRDTSALIDPKWAIDLGARAGYVVADRTLAYVRGGFTSARVATRLVDATGTTTDTANRSGWHVGGGVERYLTDKLTARIEYRYSDLSDGGGKWDRHQTLVGVAYRF